MDNVNDNTSDSKSFKYKTKITGKTEAIAAQCGKDGGNDQPPQDEVPALNIEVTIPLKYLGNFWRSLGLPWLTVK